MRRAVDTQYCARRRAVPRASGAGGNVTLVPACRSGKGSRKECPVPVRSPHPDVDIPAVCLWEFLFTDGFDEHATVVAFVDGETGESVTFGELREHVLQIAAALAERGIGRGDVVALFAPNSPAWAAVYHGVLRANAVVTTVHTLYTPTELAHQLADSRARMIITPAALLDRAAAAAKEVGLGGDAIVVL